MTSQVRNTSSIDFTNDIALQKFVEETPVEGLIPPIPESRASSNEFLKKYPHHYRVLKFCDEEKARIILNWLTSDLIAEDKFLYYYHNMALTEMSERLPVFIEVIKYSRQHFSQTVNPLRMLERDCQKKLSPLAGALSKNIADALRIENRLIDYTIKHLWDANSADGRAKVIAECDRDLAALIQKDAEAKEQSLSQPSLSDMKV